MSSSTSQGSARRASRLWITVSYFSTVGVVGLVSGIAGPTLEPLAARTGVSLATIGLIVTMRSLGYLVGAMGSGVWVDRSVPHRFLAGALLVAALCIAAIPAISWFWLLLVVMTVLGWSLGGLDVAGNALILRTYRDRSGPYLNALHFFFGLGGLAAPFLVTLAVRSSGDFSWAYWAVALVPLPFAAIVSRSPAPPKTEQPASSREPRGARLTVPFVLAASFYLFYVGGQIGLVSWLFVYVEEYATSQVATYVLAGFWGAFSLFRLLGVPISRRWDPKTILFVDFAIVVLAALPMMIWPGSRPALWISALGMGGAHASIYATGIMLLAKRAPLSGQQMSAIVVLACTGNMIFPWLMGQLLGWVGPLAVPGFSTALMVVAFAISRRVVRRQRNGHAY